MRARDHSALFRWARERLEQFDASHDVAHAQNVLFHARKILSDVKVSCAVQQAIEVAAFCHDVCDKKYVDKQKAVDDLCGEMRRLSSEQEQPYCRPREDPPPGASR